jgi:hypothetical protein
MQSQDVMSSGDAAADQKDKVLTDDINFNAAPRENISKHFDAKGPISDPQGVVVSGGGRLIIKPTG